MAARRTRSMRQSQLIQIEGITEIIPLSDLELGKTIGSGAFGVVRRGYWKTRKMPVAVKEFHNAAKHAASIKQEVQALAKVKLHENVMILYGQNFEEFPRLILQLADFSLHKLFQGRTKYTYTIDHVVNWVRQCATGVAFLHTDSQLIHRDLKPPNLLLFDCGRHLKICDFGTAKQKLTVMTQSKGTPLYMAPEVFSGPTYDEKADVYSWAIVFWEALSRRSPFHQYQCRDFNQFQILFKVTVSDLRPSRIANCPDMIWNILTVSWHPKPEERPRMVDIVMITTLLQKIYPNFHHPLYEPVTYTPEPPRLPPRPPSPAQAKGNAYPSPSTYPTQHSSAPSRPHPPLRPDQSGYELSLAVEAAHRRAQELFTQIDMNVVQRDQDLLRKSDEAVAAAERNQRFRELVDKNEDLTNELTGLT